MKKLSGNRLEEGRGESAGGDVWARREGERPGEKFLPEDPLPP